MAPESLVVRPSERKRPPDRRRRDHCVAAVTARARRRPCAGPTGRAERQRWGLLRAGRGNGLAAADALPARAEAARRRLPRRPSDVTRRGRRRDVAGPTLPGRPCGLLEVTSGRIRGGRGGGGAWSLAVLRWVAGGRAGSSGGGGGLGLGLGLPCPS